MKLKKLAIQAGTAMALYVIISLILEGEYSREIFLRELGEGVIFGLLYGLYLWARQRWMSRKEP